MRRSDREWAGLWADIVIEQVQIMSMKSGGGLTRGRGVTEAEACAATVVVQHTSLWCKS